MKRRTLLSFAFVLVTAAFALPIYADTELEKTDGMNIEQNAVIQEASQKQVNDGSKLYKQTFAVSDSDEVNDSNLEISDGNEKSRVGENIIDDKYSPDMWQTLGGKIYYAGTDGHLVKGVQNINGEYYYFDPHTRELKTDSGWINYEGSLYHSSPGGKLYKDRFIHYSASSNYYIYSDGTVAKGIVNVGNDTYYADTETGEIFKKSRWVDYNGNRYHTDNNGALYKNRSIHYSVASNYYLDKDGKLLRGIINMNSKDYFADPQTGEVLKKSRWVDLGGKRYHTDYNGALYKQRFIHYSTASDYYLGSDGSLQKGIVSIGSRLYFADPETGEIFHKSRWIDYNGFKYYSKTDGSLYRDEKFFSGTGEIFYANEAGAVLTDILGWGTVNGRKVYYEPDGIAKGYREIDGYRYYFDSNGYLASRMGIDLSAWNTVTDFNKVKESGVDFAIIRSSGTGYGTECRMYYDSKFDDFMTRAKKAGLKVGIYHFSQAITEEEARQEARMAVTQANKYGLDLPVFMDMEVIWRDSSGYVGRTVTVGREQMTKVALAFLDEVNRLGYKAGFYSNTNELNTRVYDKQIVTKFPVWLAQYHTVPTYGGPFKYWQYTSSGSVPGINGRVDMNMMFDYTMNL